MCAQVNGVFQAHTGHSQDQVVILGLTSERKKNTVQEQTLGLVFLGVWDYSGWIPSRVHGRRLTSFHISKCDQRRAFERRNTLHSASYICNAPPDCSCPFKTLLIFGRGGRVGLPESLGCPWHRQTHVHKRAHAHKPSMSVSGAGPVPSLRAAGPLRCIS